jgi:signal transduction histidine kinase
MSAMNSISRRLALLFFGFVVAGSLALAWWLGWEARNQSRELFAETARTNAEFIRKQNLQLQLSERTATALSDILRLRVVFAPLGSVPDVPEAAGAGPSLVDLPTKAPGVVTRLPGLSEEVVALPVASGVAMYLFRPEPSRIGFLTEPRTWAILGVFWLLSLALAWLLARGIVRPLRTLAARLPRITEENAEPLPEEGRADEIGQLARAYAHTRAQLVAERTAREQAERLATLGRMATGLAHEINNPVAAIKLHAQLLEGELAGAPQERVDIILDESAKIESLVSQWMFLARPQPPQMALCDLTALVAARVRSHQPAAAHARVSIVNELPPGLTVYGDHRRLAQAIANILANAVHAMAAQGGTLTIASAPESDHTIRVQFADTGGGFSPTALNRATELFFSEKEGGMGIGLSVTSEILRAHGGQLHLANTPGSGAVVSILLPVATDRARLDPAPHPSIVTPAIQRP